MRIILGSESKGRQKVLREMGFNFDVMSADIDEKAIRHDNPVEFTLALARAKAQALIAVIIEPALLITSDQIKIYGGKIREKPVDKIQADRFLKSYHSEHPIKTITSVVVTNTRLGIQAEGTDTAKIWFYKICGQVVDEYIKSGDAFLYAGAFNHEHSLLSPYVAAIDGERESILGLPRQLTVELMERVQKQP